MAKGWGGGEGANMDVVTNRAGAEVFCYSSWPECGKVDGPFHNQQWSQCIGNVDNGFD